jgi:hypothetical protein
MPQYSKAQILTLIGDNLPNNITNDITPEDLREVLIKFSDMLQDADLIAYAHDNLSGVTEVKSALDTIVAALSDTDDNLMTGKLIVALLSALSGTNRLPKTALFGADRALNRRGKIEFDNATVQSLTANVKEGDWFEWTEGESPTEGDFAEGDVAISLTNTPSVPWALDDPLYWRIYRFSKLDSIANMAAADIRDALETLTGTNMLNGDKVKYDATNSLKAKIDKKQDEIFAKRIILEGVVGTFSITLSGLLIHPIQVSVNRVPYVGKEGTSFGGELAGYDFRYEHSASNTVIVSNPSFDPRLSFNPADVIDILHSNQPLKEQE